MSSEEWRPFCLCLNIKFSTVTGWLQMLKISSIIFWQDIIAIIGLYYELTRINEAQELYYMSYRELRRVNEIQGYANCSVCKDVWASVNSQRSNDAYMRHRNMPSLVQKCLVACSAPNHYLNQYWLIMNWTLAEKFQWNIIQCVLDGSVC